MSAPLFKLNKILFSAIFLAVISNINAQLLELKPHKTTYNLQSIAGVPISTTFGEPLGSNGNSPTSDATPGQFTGFFAAGAVVAPSASGTLKLNTSISYIENAENLDLPRADDGSYALINGGSGAAIMSAQASIMFGGIIPLPDSVNSSAGEEPVRNPHAFWDKEPFRAKFQLIEIGTVDRNTLNTIR